MEYDETAIEKREGGFQEIKLAIMFERMSISRRTENYKSI